MSTNMDGKARSKKHEPETPNTSKEPRDTWHRGEKDEHEHGWQSTKHKPETLDTSKEPRDTWHWHEQGARSHTSTSDG